MPKSTTSTSAESARPTSDFADWPERVLLGALLLFVLGVALFSKSGPEGWLHLHRGSMVLDHGLVGMQGPDWFHDLILILVHRGNGMAGLVVLRAVGLLLYAVLAYGYLLARGAGPVGGAVVLATAILAMTSTLSVGPILSGVLFMGGLLFLLDRHPGPRVIWTLPLLFLLWGNVAGSTVLPGLAAAVAWVVGEAAARWRRSDRDHGVGLARLAGAVGLAAAAGLVNPVGAGVFTSSAGTIRLLPSFAVALPLIVILLVVLARRGWAAYLPHLAVAVALAAGTLAGGIAWTAGLAAAWPFLVARPLGALAIGEARAAAAPMLVSAVLLTAVCGLVWMRGGAGDLLDPGDAHAAAEVDWILEQRLAGPVGADRGRYGYVAFHLSRNGYRVVQDPAEAAVWIGRPEGTGWHSLEGAPVSEPEGGVFVREILE